MGYSQATTRTCRICLKSWPRPPFGRGWFICSKECLKEHRAKEWRESHPLDESPIKCKMCGKEFVPHPLIRYKAKYCSIRCKRRGYKESQKIWRQEHRDEVRIRNRDRHIKGKWGGNHLRALERDGRKCQICATEKRLLVHHLDNEGEKRGKNHSLDNLLTLCWGCHKAIHGVSIIKSNGGWVAKGRVFSMLGITSSIQVVA